MDYPYTISDLASICKKSRQSIYGILGKDKGFINSNKITRARKVYYSKAVLEYLLKYYSYYTQTGEEESPVILENTSVGGTSTPSFKNSSVGGTLLENSSVGGTLLENSSVGGTQTSPETPQTAGEGEGRETPYQEKINALESQIEDLKAQIEELKNDKKELYENLGFLRLTLQEERQERQLYLPAPKKRLGEKIKALFGRKEAP